MYVSIGAATLKAQVEGSSEIADLILKDGEVRYSPVVTHRVGNIGVDAVSEYHRSDSRA